MNKFFVFTIFSLFILQNSIAQDEQHLSLSQIIDSAKQKHPALIRGSFQTKTSNRWDFPPMEVSYQRGNLYGAATDYALEFKQELGSPFIQNYKNKVSQTGSELQLANKELEEKIIISEIKKAYFNIQYFIELEKIYQQKYELYLKVYNLFLLDDTLDNRKLDKLMISTSLAETDINNRTAYNNRIKTQNTLLQASFLDLETLPLDTVFEIYEIIASTDKNTRTPAHLFNNIWETNYKQAQQQYKLSKIQFTPSFFAGYSINSINQQKGFNYWMVGIQLPILAFSQVSELKKAKILTEMSRLELYEKRSENDAITANLLTDMNLYFERLNYFYDIALQQSQDLLNMAQEQLNSTDYKVEKLIWTIDKAYTIRQEYLQNILNYNLIAAELELYVY